MRAERGHRAPPHGEDLKRPWERAPEATAIWSTEPPVEIPVPDQPGLFFWDGAENFGSLARLTPEEEPRTQRDLERLVAERRLPTVGPDLRLVLWRPGSTLEDIRRLVTPGFFYHYFGPNPTGEWIGPVVQSAANQEGLWLLTFPFLQGQHSCRLTVEVNFNGGEDQESTEGASVWVDNQMPFGEPHLPSIVDVQPNVDPRPLLEERVTAELEYTVGTTVDFKLRRGEGMLLHVGGENNPAALQSLLVVVIGDHLCIGSTNPHGGIVSQALLTQRGDWHNCGEDMSVGAWLMWDIDGDLLRMRLTSRNLQ